MTPVLELKNITKQFPGVLANDHINLTLEKGEIHALLGENGAGKTTLMNILYGLYQPDQGEIYTDGKPSSIHSPSDAIRSGIGMVHQHFMLVPVFSVTENVMLGNESIRKRSNWLVAVLSALIGAVIGGISLLFVHPDYYQMLFHSASFTTSTSSAVTLWLTAILFLLSGAIAYGAYLGCNLLMGGFLDRFSVAQKIQKISKDYGLKVNPNAMIKDLPVGVQQRVEIIKLLYRNAEILIFDEPTAVLTPQESDELFKIMHSLAKQGKSIIFITHKLREVLDCADRITVIRRGKVIGTTTPKEADQAKLASMMVGRPVMLEVEKNEAKPGEVVLEVNDLEVTDTRRQVAVEKVSFELREGEILGIAGVQGNGQTELVEALTGLRPVESGYFTIKDKSFGSPPDKHWFEKTIAVLLPIGLTLLGLFFMYVTFFLKPINLQKFFIRLFNLRTNLDALFQLGTKMRLYHIQFYVGLILLAAVIVLLVLIGRRYSGKSDPRQIIEQGTAHIPEDRQRDGLVLPFPVSENLVLCTYYQEPFAHNITIQWPQVVNNAVKRIKDFDIRTPSELTPASSLSGGNQQKVIVARELSRPINLLIAAQPTRGLDVGSIEYIHNQIIAKRDEGVGVLLISTELDEIMQLSDRIAVMYRGRIVATIPIEKASKEFVGLLMAGIPLDQAEKQTGRVSTKKA